MSEREQEDEKPGNEEALAASYRNSLRLAGRGKIAAALDGIFELLREDRQFRNGQVKKVALGLLHILGEDSPITKEYRAELSSLLF
jgi:thioredoxin-like negative regulator of GroEL